MHLSSTNLNQATLLPDSATRKVRRSCFTLLVSRSAAWTLFFAPQIQRLQALPYCGTPHHWSAAGRQVHA
jgi:hypothetical protein